MRDTIPSDNAAEGGVAVYKSARGTCFLKNASAATEDGCAGGRRGNRQTQRWWSGAAQAGHVELRADDATFQSGALDHHRRPWARELFGIFFPLRVTRQVMTWIQPAAGSSVSPGPLSVFLLRWSGGRFPGVWVSGVDGPARRRKGSDHGSDIECTPETIDRVIHEVDGAEVIRQMRRRFPRSMGLS